MADSWGQTVLSFLSAGPLGVLLIGKKLKFLAYTAGCATSELFVGEERDTPDGSGRRLTNSKTTSVGQTHGQRQISQL
jgi:hypothetical protein